MKLAEALILRSDAQKRIQQLRERLARSARIQEGEQPPENPQELLDELERVMVDFVTLVKQINRTNAQTAFNDEMTLTDALAERDGLGMERNVLAGVIEAATGSGNAYNPYAYLQRGEIKTLRAINVADIQKRIDNLSRQYRELDTQIQALNWQVDVVE
ncbi:MAG: hypothetical protein D6737_01390 [Chloroflexi bacterium]|nr:MAG: hypothetical protein D6737_01390 [Chloroflexota bacterium]